MRQRLGQHFLQNNRVLEEISGALEIKEGDKVIEVGAGHGELTDFLAEAGAEVTAVEKDKALVLMLQNKFKNPKDRVEIVEGDILKILGRETAGLKSLGYKLAGNIPYYLTGKLLRTVGELKNKPHLTVFTIQKEVAERVSAKPPKMNLLGASVQIWAKPEIVSRVSKKYFKPQPKVDSAILKLITLPPRSWGKCYEDGRYYRLIKRLFKQPRKTILNNLRADSSTNADAISNILRQNNIDPMKRPQDLTVEDIKRLTDVV